MKFCAGRFAGEMWLNQIHESQVLGWSEADRSLVEVPPAIPDRRDHAIAELRPPVGDAHALAIDDDVIEALDVEAHEGDVRDDPEAAAQQALEFCATRSDRYVIHLDTDVVDFTDAPLSEHPSRNTGLKLDEMLGALEILTSGPGLVAITLTELNPQNAASDDGLLERFAASFADAISSGST